MDGAAREAGPRRSAPHGGAREEHRRLRGRLGGGGLDRIGPVEHGGGLPLLPWVRGQRRGDGSAPRAHLPRGFGAETHLAVEGPGAVAHQHAEDGRGVLGRPVLLRADDPQGARRAGGVDRVLHERHADPVLDQRRGAVRGPRGGGAAARRGPGLPGSGREEDARAVRRAARAVGEGRRAGAGRGVAEPQAAQEPGRIGAEAGRLRRALQRQDRSSDPLRHPRRAVVPGRAERAPRLVPRQDRGAARFPLPPSAPPARQGLAHPLGPGGFPLRLGAASKLRGRSQGRQLAARTRGSAESSHGRTQLGHGGVDRRRRGGRHPSAQQASRR